MQSIFNRHLIDIKWNGLNYLITHDCYLWQRDFLMYSDMAQRIYQIEIGSDLFIKRLLHCSILAPRKVDVQSFLLSFFLSFRSIAVTMAPIQIDLVTRMIAYTVNDDL